MKNTVICLLLFGISLTASAQEKVETVSMRYETQNDMPLFYQKMNGQRKKSKPELNGCMT